MHSDQESKTLSVINYKSVIAMPSGTTLNKSPTAWRLSCGSIADTVPRWGKFYRGVAPHINHFVIMHCMQGPGMLTN